VPLCHINCEKIQISSRVKGFDCKSLGDKIALTAAQQTKAIITVEEHSVIGGLGSAVAKVLAELGNSHITFKRLGIRDEFCSQVGSQEYLRKAYSLSVDGIVKVVQSVMEMTPQ